MAVRGTAAVSGTGKEAVSEQRKRLVGGKIKPFKGKTCQRRFLPASFHKEEE